MSKRAVDTFINEAVALLKADSTNITSSKDIVNQLAWLLFLKCLEISGSDRQYMGLPAPYTKDEVWQYSWASWVPGILRRRSLVNEEQRFFHETLHPQLEKYFGLKSAYLQINSNFETFQNLLLFISETEFTGKPGEDYIAQIYSALFALLTEENKKMGIFATPPAIARFMVEVLDPKPQDIVYDPACGTGDFLVATARYCLQKNAPIDTKHLYGRDSAEQIIQLAQMNMLLHGIDPKQIQQQEVERALDQGFFNTLDENLATTSVILMHPPLGRYPSTRKASYSRRSTIKMSTSRPSHDCYEAWFLEHSWRKMQAHTSYARSGMVVSSAFLDGREEQKVRMRKQFLQEWNILMIVWLPEIEFSPKSSEKTFLLFFDKRPLTKKILHYNLALRLGHRTYTYGEPIQDTDFAEVRAAWEHWKNHLEKPEKVPEPAQTEYQWVMTYDPQTFGQRPDRDPYTLLPLPPSNPQEEERLTPDELLRQIEENHLQQQQHIQRLWELLSLSDEEGNNA
jgi:type I restriction enzyme M protein